MKKVIKIIGIILVSITLCIGAIIGTGCLIVGGGYLYLKVEHNLQQKYMEKVVYSDEMKKEFKEFLTNIDPKAFTKDGVIHSYQIDKSSIKHNPMGGIDVTIIINNDKELDIQPTINNWDGKLEIGGSVTSKKLTELLEVNQE